MYLSPGGGKKLSLSSRSSEFSWRMGKKHTGKGRHTHERQRPEHPGVQRRERVFPLIARDKLPEKGTFQMALRDMRTWEESGSRPGRRRA